MNKSRILIHYVFVTVFVTKNRYQTIPLTKREALYRYIHGIVENHECNLLEINGMSDHIHLLINLNPKIASAFIIKQIKGSTSKWMKGETDFVKFDGWGKGYFAASVSPTMAEKCENYIINQELHHGGKGLLDEIRYLINLSKLEWYDDDWQ